MDARPHDFHNQNHIKKRKGEKKSPLNDAWEIESLAADDGGERSPVSFSFASARIRVLTGGTQHSRIYTFIRIFLNPTPSNRPAFLFGSVK